MSLLPSYETVVLPLADAIALEAKQNMERDRRTLGDEEVDGQDATYLEEAEHLLAIYGEGYVPDFADHKLVKVQRASAGIQSLGGSN